MNKPTPGPWRVGKAQIAQIQEKQPYDPLAIYGGGQRLAILTGALSDEWQANARLMAAAPDLLAALEAMRERCTTMSQCGTIEVTITPDLYLQIEAAIAKATSDD